MFSNSTDRACGVNQPVVLLLGPWHYQLHSLLLASSLSIVVSHGVIRDIGIANGGSVS